MTKFSELQTETPDDLSEGYIHWWNPDYIPANRNKKTSFLGFLNVWAQNIGLSNFIRQNEPHTFSANQATQVVELTQSSSTVLVNGAAGNYFRLMLTQNSSTLAVPSPLLPGPYVFTIIQDATGGRSLTFASGYKFPLESDKSLSLAPNAEDVLSCLYDGRSLKCFLAKNFES